MMDKTKTIEIEKRTFVIHKFDAKSALKISKLVLAKILPIFDTVLPVISASTDLSQIKVDEAINLEAIAKALDLIDDKDLDRIIDVSLQYTFEQLKSGLVRVLNSDGTYGVIGVEDDPVIVLRLVIESIAWSLRGFFDGSRLTSVLAPLTGLLTQTA